MEECFVFFQLCLTHELNRKAKRSPRRKESEGLQDGLFSASEKSLFSTLSMKCIPIIAGSRVIIPLLVPTCRLLRGDKLLFSVPYLPPHQQSYIRVSVPWRLEVEPRDSWVYRVSSNHSSGGLSGGVRVQRRLKLLERRSKRPASRTLTCISKTKSAGGAGL